MKMKNSSDRNVCDSSRIKVALFCGGRGSATLIHELLRWPNVQLTLLVNAYDDGLSTGALRDCIAHMLGPSDFRKNLSYLLDPYSDAQYALKNLLELRFPQSESSFDITHIKDCILSNTLMQLPEPYKIYFLQVGSELAHKLRQLLIFLFTYMQNENISFDYRDCSIGNLLFAGAFLKNDHNFNAAAKEMSDLVSSRAQLVNVSKGDNQILVGLKEDGELLLNEAQMVGPQSVVPIRHIYLIDKPIVLAEWEALHDHTVDEKEAWLRAKDRLPDLSVDAEKTLRAADIIIFGPGTQHSSLFPSYRIVQHHVQKSAAVVKILVMNLEPDYDIVSLSTRDIVDKALFYMGDPTNHHQVVTHILLNNACQMNHDTLLDEPTYKNCVIIQDEFSDHVKGKVHNGGAVIETILSIWDKISVKNCPSNAASVSIFLDLHTRSLALTELYEEILEIDWKSQVQSVELVINQAKIDQLKETDTVKIYSTARDGHFPEIGYFLDWIKNGQSEYLILLTGDGKYHFRDVLLALKLLEQSHFGAVFGSRNQSRAQFRMSLRAAYGEKKILSMLSFFGSFLISTIFALRFSILFSDPLTGFRLFKRSKIVALVHDLEKRKITTSIHLATYLIKNQVEIAELPVTYRTFAGFADPYWRMHRGIQSLLSTLTRHAL